MKTFITAISAVVLLSSTAQAVPVGLKAGKDGSVTRLGSPTPSPTPSPMPTPTPGSTLVIGTNSFGTWGAIAADGPQGGCTSVCRPAIVQWEMVPYQGVTSSDNQICVAAFASPTSAEYSGGTTDAIAKVRFWADGGAPTDITTTITGRSGKQMYCANLDQSSVGTNKLIEIRAEAYPTFGQPVVLQGTGYDAPINAQYWALPLVANYSPTRYYISNSGSGSTCSSGSPCADLVAVKNKLGNVDMSNIEVCFNAGTYGLDNSGLTRTANTGFLTMKPCPGVAKTSVTVNSWGSGNKGAWVDKFHLQGVQVTGPNRSDGQAGSSLWVDDVTWDANGKDFPCSGCEKMFFRESYVNLTGGIWVTDSFLTDAYSTGKWDMLLRNTTIDNINEDAAHNARTVLNIIIQNVTFCCSVHPDVQQNTAPQSGFNHVVYGVNATNNVNQQGLFSSDTGVYQNAAFVDVAIQNTGNYFVLQWGAAGNHSNVYARNLNLVGTVRLSSMTASEFYVIDSSCSQHMGSYSGFTYYGSPTCQ